MILLLLFLGLLSTTTAITISDIPIASEQISARDLDIASPQLIKNFHQYQLLRRVDPLTQHRDAATTILQTYFQKETQEKIDPTTIQANALRAIGTRTTKIPDIHFVDHIRTALNLHPNTENDKMLQEFIQRHKGESTLTLIKEARNEQSKSLQALAKLRKEPGTNDREINLATLMERDKTIVLQSMLLERDTSLSPQEVAKALKEVASKSLQDLRFEQREEPDSFRELVGKLKEIPV